MRASLFCAVCFRSITLRALRSEHKNGKWHSVYLNSHATDVLLRRKGDHPTHVFTYEGQPIVQVNTKAWRNALVRAGINDFRWHDLRHTFAT